MKTDFHFSNLLGTVYGSGNLLFSPDGSCLLSPVGNRVTIFNLAKDQSTTLPFTHRKPISRLALHPLGSLLLSADNSGRAILSHIHRRITLYYFTFRNPLTALEFSPCGKYFAAAFERKIEVWHTPSSPEASVEGGLEYAPFIRHRTYTGHYDEVLSLQWSSDSRFFLSTSKDLSARIWSLNPESEFVPTTLAGHRVSVLRAWFSQDQESIWTLSKDGALFNWQYIQKPDTEEEILQWRITSRHYFFQTPAYVTCAAFHAKSNLLFTGFSSGLFTIHELPDFTEIQSLSVSQANISNIIVNPGGNWLALSSAKLSQLLVWDWQSESYILKQQSHHDSLNALAYTLDSRRIVTCSDDGKVKLWDTQSGFCTVTFTEHTSGVTACEFAKRGTVLFTSSLDGSIRAWDLLRYRNFRTFTAPDRIGWSCLAVDPAGEVVAAGSHDTDVIHLWSVQNGQLLDQLAGHEGPISCLAFTQDGSSLISGSWDNTVRVWNVFSRHQASESFTLQANVLALAVRPDSKQIAVATLDGQLSFWSLANAVQIGGVDGRQDISGGRKITDRRTAANVAGTKFYSTITYSSDGSCLLAAGKSKYICLYECQSGMLVQKFTVSINLALDGTQEILNSKLLTEAGPSIDEDGEESDIEDRIDHTLPGAQRGDASVRKNRPEIRVAGVAFAPTGQGFCAASTEGLLIYSVDAGKRFDPIDLEIETTPESTLKTLKKKEYTRALSMAFKLNIQKLSQNVFESVPAKDVPLVVSALPHDYLARLIRLVVEQAERGPHVEFCLLWLKAIVSSAGTVLRDRKVEFGPEIRAIARVIASMERDLRGLAEQNGYAVDYLLAQTPKNETEGRIAEVMNGYHDESGKESEEVDEEEAEWMGLD